MSISRGNAKTGILLVAFGPGTLQSEAALRRVQHKAESRFGLPVRLAFTSDLIRERLARARTKSDSVLKALQRMKFDRYTQVAVQSLHLIPGLEYTDVLADAGEAKGLQVQVGLPLLNNEHDACAAAEMLIRHLPADRRAGEAVVCMAHGSRHEAEWLYETWSQAVSAIDPLVFVACMKGRVTLDTVLPQLAVLQPARVWLLPLLSVVGKHTLQDMAGADSGGQKQLVAPSWKSRIEDAGYVCVPDLRGLADGPEFVDAWLDRLEVALSVLADEPTFELDA